MYIHLPTRAAALKSLQLIAAIALAICVMYVLNLLLGDAPASDQSAKQTDRSGTSQPVHLPSPPLVAQREA